MSGWAKKRFWKEAQVVPGDTGFGIALDGRPVKTPAKAALTVPTRALGQAIADEWNAQEGELKPETMPYTRAANAALDKVTLQRAEVADLLADYGDSDLLCYRAVAPAELAQRQAEGWDPLLDWAAAALGARLEPRAGLMHAPQPAAAVATLRARVHDLDPFQLTAFHDLVSLSGSLVLGFAAALGQDDPDRIWALSRLDETWQAEQWGADDEAEKVSEIKRAAFLHAKRFWDAVHAPD